MSVAEVHPVADQHGVNLFDTDPDLGKVLALYLPQPLYRHLLPQLKQLGGLAGGVLDTLAHTADKNLPALLQRTRSGIDAQRSVKHPAYVEMERVAFSQYGLAAMSHRAGVLGWDAPLPPAAKYALTYLFMQAEFGLCCPLSMTDSLTRTLRKFGAPELVQCYLPRLTTQVFDELYQGAMFMTEQGAGCDVAATATRAGARRRGLSAVWRQVVLLQPGCRAGHGAGAHRRGAGRHEGRVAVPAAAHAARRQGQRLPHRAPEGQAGHTLDGQRRDPPGQCARAFLVGEAGRGLQQMADMVNNSRLSNGVRAAGLLMRRACSEALFIARERRAFGRRLMDMPLMRRQLLKLLLPAEQARTMVFQTAEALRRADAGEAAAYPLVRILTPLIKFRACRDARKATGDAMQVRGGCGYIEDWADPRLVRDAHLGSIWEGTSNIVALDVLRAIRREGSLSALDPHLRSLLAQASLHAQARKVFDDTLSRTIARAASVAETGERGDALARQVGSSLYHLTTCVAMAWEAGRMRSARRMRLAQLVLRQRLLPQDPLGGDDAEPAWLPALIDPTLDDPDVAGVNLF